MFSASKHICMMMLMIGSNMHKAEHDLKTIIYPACDTYRRLHGINGNKIQQT